MSTILMDPVVPSEMVGLGWVGAMFGSSRTF